MLGFFPTLYPDELLYSAIARYQIRSGNSSPKLMIEELFNSRTITAIADLPSGLDNLVQNLSPLSSITVDILIQQHTLYPYYAPFLPPKRVRKIETSMKANYGGNIHTRTGIMASAITTPQYFRFCSGCLQDDLNKYGETYWHRLHQTPGVLFCPTHKIPLQDSTILIQGLNKHVYHAASQDNCTAKAKEFTHNREIAEKLISIAQDISHLLDNAYPSRTLDWFTRRYQTLLIEKGYANAIARVQQKRLINDFVEFYGEEFLTTIDSMVIYEDESNWLSQISKKHRKGFHPIRHLLLIRFLTKSVDTFFQNNKQYRPFGRSPWLCLNAAADHYLQPVITDLKVSHCLENKKPLGTFTCSCGMIYSRSGEDQTEEDKLRIGRVITYGQVWEDKLKELVEVKKLGLRAIARELRVDPNTVNRYVFLLDLTPSWTTGNQSKPKKIQKAVKNLPDREKLAKEKKDRWLNLQQENPELSKTEIRKLAPDIYVWLYRHDKNWLNENSPKPKKPKSSVDRVDWSVRDTKILAQAQNAVDEILKVKKPVRITIGKVGTTLGCKALLEKHLDKLPRTRAYLETVTETVEDFQIRRIEWAISELDLKGEEIKDWKILRLAGLRRWPKSLS